MSKYDIGGRLGFVGDIGFTHYEVEYVIRNRQKFTNTEGSADKWAAQLRQLVALHVPVQLRHAAGADGLYPAPGIPFPLLFETAHGFVGDTGFTHFEAGFVAWNGKNFNDAEGSADKWARSPF